LPYILPPLMCRPEFTCPSGQAGFRIFTSFISFKINSMPTTRPDTNDQYFWNFVYSVLFVLLVMLSWFYLKSIGPMPDKIPVFDFILLALAIFRLIRLFVYDSITNFIRDHFAKYENGPGKTLSNLLGCPWCTGVWMAFGVVFFYFATPFAWYPILILALAGTASFIQVTIRKIGHGL